LIPLLISVRLDNKTPIIGLWSRVPGYEVHYSQFHHAAASLSPGQNIIAIDATLRERPGGETVASMISRIHENWASR